MSSQRLKPQPFIEPKGRPVGGTEYSWCRAVSGGTGIAILAILLSKSPDIARLQNAIHKLQNSHPILKSRIHSNTSTNTISFITYPGSTTPSVQIKSFSLSATSSILDSLSCPTNNISPFHAIVEHELNQNDWYNILNPSSCTTVDTFFASIYTLPDTKCAVVFRVHVSACDRTTAVSILRELLVLMGGSGEGEKDAGEKEILGNDEEKISLGIEDLIPSGKAKKTLWARGVDMFGYSVGSLRFTNLKFKDTRSPRSSQGCKSRGIKLCGALVAAGLIAAYSSKRRAEDQRKKYGVVTLSDCRSILDPALSTSHFGFYHSAILNTHLIRGGEKLWELAQKTYVAFANSKNCNKHFLDMADLNFLMCRAIENPGLTASSSLRTSFMSVFEDPVIDESSEMRRDVIGVEDFIGCASVHGIGPSIAIFDKITDGGLDCVCVYPAPLHSREQMQELVDTMKGILVEGGNYYME
ncbi:uncharacterized protein LOC122275470 isoform X2 [Carya illinoinensis]|uniref:Uncharacterized protein n=1 Tax=Carya illinoinensis TaxID=32201 RepID=A0A8T1P9A0_CARIL|nr:uncharacterized protein LOC122275470 isoform X2 [Carya illinoinensis]KAG6640609.1 hypothetical protein CIPAW_09G015900 [Carya illinoinensis]KAG6693728.1 hypothetical protein I3842_09G015700 [Carya illinoinensis]